MAFFDDILDFITENLPTIVAIVATVYGGPAGGAIAEGALAAEGIAAGAEAASWGAEFASAAEGLAWAEEAAAGTEALSWMTEAADAGTAMIETIQRGGDFVVEDFLADQMIATPGTIELAGKNMGDISMSLDATGTESARGIIGSGADPLRLAVDTVSPADGGDGGGWWNEINKFVNKDTMPALALGAQAGLGFLGSMGAAGAKEKELEQLRQMPAIQEQAKAQSMSGVGRSVTQPPGVPTLPPEWFDLIRPSDPATGRPLGIVYPQAGIINSATRRV